MTFVSSATTDKLLPNFLPIIVHIYKVVLRIGLVGYFAEGLYGRIGERSLVGFVLCSIRFFDTSEICKELSVRSRKDYRIGHTALFVLEQRFAVWRKLCQVFVGHSVGKSFYRVGRLSKLHHLFVGVNKLNKVGGDCHFFLGGVTAYERVGEIEVDIT